MLSQNKHDWEYISSGIKQAIRLSLIGSYPGILQLKQSIHLTLAIMISRLCQDIYVHTHTQNYSFEYWNEYWNKKKVVITLYNFRNIGVIIFNKVSKPYTK